MRLTRDQAANLETFVANLETAIAPAPASAGEGAGVIFIAHSIELEEFGLEGAVFSYGHTEYTHADHTRSIADFYRSLLEEGKIGRYKDKLKLAEVAFTGNPVNDIIQIAGGLLRKELEAKAARGAV